MFLVRQAARLFRLCIFEMKSVLYFFCYSRIDQRYIDSYSSLSSHSVHLRVYDTTTRTLHALAGKQHTTSLPGLALRLMSNYTAKIEVV